jgi:integrase
VSKRKPTKFEVEAFCTRGRMVVSEGLYLQVSKWGTKSWEFRFRLRGKTRSMGLGAYDSLTLKAARDLAELLRLKVKNGIDPIDEKKVRDQEAEAAKLQAAIEATRLMTFKDAVDAYMQEGRIAKFKNEKHRKQWRSTLDMYAVKPKHGIGSMNVALINDEDIVRVLKPIWKTKTETASRLRGRIEAVLRYATTEKRRSGENPASLAVLKHWIENQGKAETRKQSALKLKDLSAWFAELKKRDGIAPRALEFLTLCAARSGEVRGATWHEFDFESKTWIIPEDRMKAGEEHIVPLSDEALALLRNLPRLEGCEYVFPAARGGMLSDAALSAVMKRMQEAETKAGRDGWLDAKTKRPAVPHGLRSTFRDWAGEQGYERDLAEMALAHVVGTKVERSYRRTALLERRRPMLAAWALACLGGRVDNVVPIRGAV